MKILLPLLVLIAGCQTTTKLPNVPKTVTVTISEFRPLPDWATAPLANNKPKRTGDLGRDHLAHEDALDAAYDALLGNANCHRRLLRKLDAGESIDLKECLR